MRNIKLAFVEMQQCLLKACYVKLSVKRKQICLYRKHQREGLSSFAYI